MKFLLEYFQDLGYAIAYSNDGKFEKSSIEKFGFLDTIAKMFLDGKCYPLFEKFIEEKNPKNPKEGVLLNDDRIYLNIDYMRKLSELEKYLELSKRHIDNIDSLLDHLMETNTICESAFLNRHNFIHVLNSGYSEEIIPNKEIDDFLNELIERKVIRKGFIFKCNLCLNADWYSINEIDETYTCKRCGKTQYYTSKNLFRQLDDFEPHWFYKLDEVFLSWI